MINIIIPSYNCSKTLGRTLASLVAQTDMNFDVTIVDDCSTEDIMPIVDEYKKKLHITYIRNEQNLGCGMTRQVGIDNATQKFITFLDSDDVFMPYTVETFNAIIAANPNTELVHSYFYEQVIIDGAPALYKHKDNYTACHGKLYNVDLIRQYNIRNSPKVKWADDSFFNSMCLELMQISIIKIPTMVWCNNKESIIRRDDPIRSAQSRNDFLDALIMSAQFVLAHKSHLDYMYDTAIGVYNSQDLSPEEREKAQLLLKFIKGG